MAKSIQEDAAKALGLADLTQGAEISTVPKRTLQGWFNSHPQKFKCMMLGAAQLIPRTPSLPPVRNYPESEQAARAFEIHAGISDDVLFKLKQFTNVVKGRYIRSADEWQVDGMSGGFPTSDVEEWWLFPKIGTGIKPPALGIPVVEEPEGMGRLEGCYFCPTSTTTWHLETNTPVCESCAKTKSVSDIVVTPNNRVTEPDECECENLGSTCHTCEDDN